MCSRRAATTAHRAHVELPFGGEPTTELVRQAGVIDPEFPAFKSEKSLHPMAVHVLDVDTLAWCDCLTCLLVYFACYYVASPGPSPL